MHADRRAQARPSFAAGVRNSLRRKPALIMVGELRDMDTVLASVEAAQTGHPIYTTTHANDVAHIRGASRSSSRPTSRSRPSTTC